MTERPWWASGAPGLDDDQDPVDAHRAGRRGDTDPLGEAARRFAEAVGGWTNGEPNGGPGDDGHGHRAAVQACGVCPVCTVIRLVGEVRPEVVEHLAAATRHLTLAAKAVVDAQAARTGGGERLERIRLDDE